MLHLETRKATQNTSEMAWDKEIYTNTCIYTRAHLYTNKGATVILKKIKERKN